ncbi:MAG: zinc-ribbon domain-containing protein [Rickettsiales bacterium]|jgi:hypothetical protein|nr:zinc-ribbon domain-containing protein [Rickettsiales bacterium]
MVIKCPFCKTQYKIPGGGNVKCACCGAVWRAGSGSGGGRWLKLLAAITALLAAVLFSAVAILRTDAKKDALEIITDRPVATAGGIIVSGRIVNNTEKLFGAPDLMVSIRDGNGAVIKTARVIPNAAVIDSGAVVYFSSELTVSDAKKITVGFAK